MPKKTTSYIKAVPAPEGSIFEGTAAAIEFRTKKDKKKKRTKRVTIRTKLIEDLRARRKSLIHKRKAINKEISAIKRDLASLTGRRRKKGTKKGKVESLSDKFFPSQQFGVSKDYTIDLEKGTLDVY